MKSVESVSVTKEAKLGPQTSRKKSTLTPEKVHLMVLSLNRDAKSPFHRWTYVERIPFGPDSTKNVEKFVLGNGLTLLLYVDRATPIVTYHSWYKVGSRHERKTKTGLAHLFEHLMFGQTENLPAGAFDNLLEKHGAESNAATWLDWTYYYESLPSSDLELVVRLEAERMQRLVLMDDTVASEKEVVANERRYRVDDDVTGSIGELLYDAAFDVHPYKMPTIGFMDDIRGLTIEDCRSFYRTYYAPNNVNIVVAGDVKPARLLELIRDAYGDTEPSPLPEEDIEPEPLQKVERRRTLSKRTSTSKLVVAFHGPACGDVDHGPLSLLSEILFGGRASRLYKSLVTDSEMASDIRAWPSTFRDPGLFEIWITARENQSLEKIESCLFSEMAKVCDELVSKIEMERAVARVEYSLLQSMESLSGKAEQIGFGETVLFDPNSSWKRLRQLGLLSRGQLRTVARKYFRQENRTVFYVLPTSEDADIDQPSSEK